MLIVGQISTKEEAEEIAFIAKSFVIGNRIRTIAHNHKKSHYPSQ